MAKPERSLGKEGRYHHGDLRNALLKAGLELLAEGSSEALTLREVARRAGVTHAAPYRHFASKEAMLAVLATQGFLALTQTMLEAQSGHVDPVPRFLWSGVGYVRFALRHPAQLRLMFRESLGFETNVELKAAGEAAFQILVEGIVTLQAAGITRAGDPLPLAWTSWATVHGLSILLLDQALGHLGVTKAHAEDAALTACGHLVEGLRAR